jgi:hypothetical protein
MGTEDRDHEEHGSGRHSLEGAGDDPQGNFPAGTHLQQSGVLKEGAVVQDFMKPDRVVVDVDSEHSREVLMELYSPTPRVWMRGF